MRDGHSEEAAARTKAGGSDFVVVANRLPVSLRTDEDGAVSWTESPGGLVTALEPVLQARSGTWVGWSGAPDSADIAPPGQHHGYTLVDVPLTAADVDEFYDGFCNDTLWPLYHDKIVSPVYHRQTWEAYRRVNERFAEACADAAAEGGTVWVQDYQLQLVPGLLRTLRPDLRIGFFLHIPLPPVALFAQLPWRRQVVEGILGADVVGFHRKHDADNFCRAAELLVGVPSDGHRRDHTSMLVPGSRGARHVLVGAFPISIDTAAIDALARSEEVVRRAAQLRRDLGSPRLLLLGVDRLDYTKGIDVRLKAFAELLASGELDAGDTILLQIATPSREGVANYQRMRDEIELIVGRTMGSFARAGSSPVQYLHQNLPREELVAFYRAADIMLVTPLRDGMNLVAKEYVAARADEAGALILSEFTGAADELRQAFLVNPYDTDGLKAAIVAADRAAPDELAHRMKGMRQLLFRNDVHRWASDFLGSLADA